MPSDMLFSVQCVSFLTRTRSVERRARRVQCRTRTNDGGYQSARRCGRSDVGGGEVSNTETRRVLRLGKSAGWKPEAKLALDWATLEASHGRARRKRQAVRAFCRHTSNGLGAYFMPNGAHHSEHVSKTEHASPIQLAKSSTPPFIITSEPPFSSNLEPVNCRPSFL